VPDVALALTSCAIVSWPTVRQGRAYVERNANDFDYQVTINGLRPKKDQSTNDEMD